MSNCCGGLSIEKWRDILQYHPYFFYQLANNTNMKITTGCNQLVREYDWLTADMVGRVDIRRAIDTAVEKLTDELDYSPYPRYFEEVHSLNYHMFRGRGCAVVRLDLGKVLGFGIEAFEEIATDLPMSITDRNSDNVDDTWQVTLTGEATPPVELEDAWLYPNAADLPYLEQPTTANTYDCRYLVKPVRVATGGGDTFYYGKSWEVVKPSKYALYTELGNEQIDPNTDTNFWEEPTLLRRYTNSDGVTTTTAAVIFEFDNPCGCAGCGCNGQSLPYTRLGQAVNWDARTGEVVVYPATFNAETEVWTPSEFCGCHLPDRVRVRYYAGDDDACKWDPIVARLAAAELARPICACTTANRELARWQFDLARSAGANDEQYILSPADLDNPFGTRRGHVEAWKHVLRLGLVRAVAL